MALTCSITTPERLVHEGPAHLVVVPASDGELGVLQGHAPLLALLGTGELRIRGETRDPASFFVRGGFVQILRDRVNVLATEAEEVPAIDPQDAAREAETLAGEVPGTGLSVEDREAWNERVRAARLRARLAARSRESGRPI